VEEQQCEECDVKGAIKQEGQQWCERNSDVSSRGTFTNEQEGNETMWREQCGKKGQW
jgi:hypothetical protein